MTGRSQSLAESVIKHSVSILRDILCGSMRPIKELASPPLAKGNSVGRETVTISPCLLSRIGRKTAQEDLDTGEQGPMAALQMLCCTSRTVRQEKYLATISASERASCGLCRLNSPAPRPVSGSNCGASHQVGLPPHSNSVYAPGSVLTWK